MTWAESGWAVAVAFAAAYALRRRGEWEVWAGHVHAHSGLTLAGALELCRAIGPGSCAAIRRDGRIMVSVTAADHAGHMARGGRASARGAAVDVYTQTWLCPWPAS